VLLVIEHKDSFLTEPAHRVHRGKV
jgi:hypothetical protein